jgi:hypothetical protein
MQILMQPGEKKPKCSFKDYLAICAQVNNLFGTRPREIFSMGKWEHIKLGELPRHNGLGFLFFCWGRSLKIHIEIKKGSCLSIRKEV